MKTDLYVGVDLHKDSLTTFGKEHGVADFTHTISTKCRNAIAGYFRDLAERHTLHVCVESVGFYQWFWDLVAPTAHVMTLADAAGVRAAAGRKAKTDRNDAETLARLLMADSLPTAFVPDEQLRELRQMERHRMRISRHINSVKNSIRREMLKLNFPGPKELDTGSLHKWFTAQHDKLTDMARYAINDLAEELALLERQLLRAGDRLNRLVLDTPRFKEPIERIMTIPGIALLTATVIHAESGGLERFDTAEEIVCYAGLAPRTFQSGNECRHGHIGKDGPAVMRKCLVNAAWTAVRCEPTLKKLFAKWCKKSGKKKAIIKLAAKLLVWAWALVKKNRVFDASRIAA